ncbi:ribonuclease P protein component [Microterricola viridarii]|uniref:ribonuclease P protein component n=1 Tax=Microterricola viridarii TaxID=412690 RepID=UPI0009EBF02F|nr:ribonuclease P protein component [Microterricola viridarii]
MLAKANRITTADDYKGVVRRGRRYVTAHFVTYVRSGAEVQTSAARGARFGFIVAKTVGGAVQRNRVRRRLKAATFALLDQVPSGADVVIRALPGSSDISWDTVQSEVSTSLRRSSNHGAARRSEVAS